ncbi:MAG: 30S ribosomal protein S9 [Nanoarchaeota archaeon]|nr:30S ribosomal protein S9 [Nanoarchaeota archaeon]
MVIKKKKIKKIESKSIVTSGKRKRANAKATIREGTGVIRINMQPIRLLSKMHQLIIQEPLQITEKIIPELTHKIDIEIKVNGGGREAQLEAARLAIGRALVAYTKNMQLKDALISYDRHLFTADIRRKETRKPGDSKARAKRQKSYR